MPPTPPPEPPLPPEPTFEISLSESGTFNFTAVSYGNATAPRNVMIFNTGNQPTGLLSIEITGTNAADFELSEGTINNIAVDGSSSFTIEPLSLLPVGTYTATVTVTGANVISASFNISATVNRAPLTLELSSNTLSPIPGSDYINITVTGLIGSDTVSLSTTTNIGAWGVTPNSGFTTLTYDGTTEVEEPAQSITFSLLGPAAVNYTLANPVNILIHDGQEADDNRAIPVTQSNISAFNNYANTEGTDGGVNKHYILTENIELTLPNPGTSNWTPIGTPFGGFIGTFNGGGHTISNMVVIHDPLKSFVGMFEIIGEGGEVRSLGVLNVNFTGSTTVGGIAGHLYGTIEDCYTTGIITGQGGDTGGHFIGGIAGIVGDNGTIDRCFSTALISGRTNVGGITGHLSLDGIIGNSVALNPNLVSIGGSESNFGRIAGFVAVYPVLPEPPAIWAETYNIYTRDGMAPGTVPTNENGLSRGAIVYNNRAFWEDDVNFSFTDSTPVGPWRWDDTTGLPFMGITPTIID
jgi:hypothetical protein